MALALAACRQEAATPAAAALPHTTDGALAVGNLQSNIIALQTYLGRPGVRSPTREADLATVLDTRAKYLGTLDDLDRALELTAKASAAMPQSGALRLRHASALAGLHLFDEASKELAAAEKLGETGPSADSLRASILQARGEVDAAVELRRRAVAGHASIDTLGGLAAALAQRRDLAEAEKTFDRALTVYRDTAPFPVAWIDFQRGLMFEREGRLDEARARYQAALDRLPAYAQAASHLAALVSLRGDHARAEQLLRPLLATSDDPEYRGQLAQVRRAAGDTAEAEALHEQARAGYERLLARHPAAFADHAARFFLPDQPARALSLARQNLATRQTWEAFDLALSAALAAGDGKATCALYAQVKARTAPPRRIEVLAERARAACSRASGASELTAR